MAPAAAAASAQFTQRWPELKGEACDCEVLSPKQQLFLNSLVRSSKSPIVWVISFIRGAYDTTNTLIPSQSLTDADRELHFLDAMAENEFETFCQNVASLRLFYSLSETKRKQLRVPNPLAAFDLKARLGTFSLNQLLDHQIQQNLSRDARSLRLKALSLAEEIDSKAPRKAGIRHASPLEPAYTQLKTISTLGWSIDDHVLSDRHYKAFQRTLARKQRAAFLLVANEAQLDGAPYAGSGIVLALSDLCIRDFLDIMAEIFVEETGIKGKTSDHAREGDIFSFADKRTTITIANQRAAIKRASTKKVEGTAHISTSYTVDIARFIRGIGDLTRRLQVEVGAAAALGSPERGLFELDFDGLVGATDTDMAVRIKAQEIVLQAIEDGLLQVDDQNDEPLLDREGHLRAKVVVRLHRRFAPHFGFSFRGAYERFKLPAWALREILTATDTFAFMEWLERVAPVVVNPNQPDLFGED